MIKGPIITKKILRGSIRKFEIRKCKKPLVFYANSTSSKENIKKDATCIKIHVNWHANGVDV